MSISITAKTVYTIKHSDYPNESYDIEGIKGLERYFKECLGGLVDLIDGESWTSTKSRSKLKFYESTERHLNRFETIIELKKLIEDIKNQENERE